jgi:hypothetical protein
MTASGLYTAREIYYLNNETMSSQTWSSLRASGLTAAVMQGYPRITIIFVPSMPDFYFLLIRWRVSEIKRLHTEAKKKARRENKTRAIWGGRASRARRAPPKIKRVAVQFLGVRKTCGSANTVVSKTEN